ncbi:nuclear hormone receptor, partial [Schistosoma japonicum]
LSNQLSDISQQIVCQNSFYTYEQQNLTIPSHLDSHTPHMQHLQTDQTTVQLTSSNKNNSIHNEISTNSTLQIDDYKMLSQGKNELNSTVFTDSNYFISNAIINILPDTQFASSECINPNIQQQISESCQSQSHYLSDTLFPKQNHNYSVIPNSNNNCNDLSYIKTSSVDMDCVVPTLNEADITAADTSSQAQDDIVMMRSLTGKPVHFEASEQLSENTMISNDLVNNLQNNFSDNRCDTNIRVYDL